MSAAKNKDIPQNKLPKMLPLMPDRSVAYIAGFIVVESIAANGTLPKMIAKLCRWYLDTTSQPAERLIFSRRFRYYLWSRDRGRCQYCGIEVEPNGEWHIEHIIPYSAAKDWPYINDEQNLVVACIPCNMAKGTKLRLPKGYYQLPPKFWRNILKMFFRSWT